MQGLSSYFFCAGSGHLENNIREISNFPEEESAAISASSGLLARTDGTISSWKSWFVCDDLCETAKSIDSTFKEVAKQFKLDFSRLREVNFSSEQIEVVKSNLQAELSMITGLRNIKAVYHKRYDANNEKTTDLQLLDSIVEGSESVICRHGAKFAFAIDEFRRQAIKPQAFFDLSASILQPKAITKFSTQDVMSRLDAYIHEWCPGMQISRARAFIAAGRQIYAQVLQGRISSPADCSEGEEEALANLSWFLMRLAMKKRQAHSQGSFAIEDEGGRLYAFLLNAKGCAARESSHYKDRSMVWNGVSKHLMHSSLHYGVDITNGLLPAEKRHILFGQVDAVCKREAEKLLFIKLEDYSPFKTTAYGYDMTMHGVDLIVAQYKKSFHPGSDDLPEMAKERVPVKTLEEFSQLVLLFGEPALKTCEGKMRDRGYLYDRDPIKAAKIGGIAYMSAFMEELHKLPNLPEGYHSSGFCSQLTGLDHQAKRTGREVYLTVEEVRGFVLDADARATLEA